MLLLVETFTVNNYTSGDYIPVTPTAPSTSYSLVSVVDATNPCCIGTGNSGNPTITVSALPVTPIAITADPAGPICAGDPTLLTVVGAGGITNFCNPAASFDSAGGMAHLIRLTYSSGLPVTGVSVQSVTIMDLAIPGHRMWIFFYSHQLVRMLF